MSSANEPTSLMKYWPLFVAAIGIAVTWGTLANRVAILETRVGVTESRIVETDKGYNVLTNQITELKTILQERLPVKR